MATIPQNLNTTPLWNGGVQSLFKLYYWRDATPAELTYWKNKSDAQLRPNLIPNSAVELARNKKASDKPVPAPAATAPQAVAEDSEAVKRLKASNEYINSRTDIDEAGKIILRTLLKQQQTSWIDYYQPDDIKKLLSDAAIASETDLTPYYNKVTSQEVQDLKNKMADLRWEAARYADTEKADYAATLDKTRKNLRASWLTFSGMQRKTLGAEWAISSEWVEGTVPQARRFDYSEKSNSIQERARDTGIAAERRLGSGALNNLQWDLGAIADPYAWTTTFDPTRTKALYKVNQAWTPDYTSIGDIALEKKKELEKSKWSRLGSLNQYLQ